MKNRDLVEQYYRERILCEGNPSPEELSDELCEVIYNSVGFAFWRLDMELKNWGKSVEEAIKKDLFRIKNVFRNKRPSDGGDNQNISSPGSDHSDRPGSA